MARNNRNCHQRRGRGLKSHESLISQGTKPLSFTLTDYSYKVRNWLYWYDESGRRLLTLEEEVEQAGQRAEQEKQRADRLTQKLRELGLNPEDL
jgi:hypothetical protein